MHDVTRESVVVVTDHFAEAFVRENVACVYMTLWRRNDVRKFDTDTILFREIKHKRKDNKCLSDVFSAVKKSGKICKNKDHNVCFIALTLAGSLGRCLNTWPNSLVFKQLPRDPANVNA